MIIADGGHVKTPNKAFAADRKKAAPAEKQRCAYIAKEGMGDFF